MSAVKAINAAGTKASRCSLVLLRGAPASVLQPAGTEEPLHPTTAAIHGSAPKAFLWGEDLTRVNCAPTSVHLLSYCRYSILVAPDASPLVSMVL